MTQEAVKQVSERDLMWILAALLELAGGEGCHVAETLCSIAGAEDGMRIYNEVLS